ncbi:MAG: hypothetical protein COB08_015510 [Rhodobacteraceae bacterium]|nr:hypothetical protein [Paracoccaceae bacterium]
MENGVTNNLAGMFDSVPQIFSLGLAGIMLVLAGFFLIKGYWRLRGNTAFTSYQQGVIAPVKYGDRGPEARDDAFARRLEEMVETEEAYEMSKLMPHARELGAIRDSEFHTAPVLEGEELGILALIEDVAHDLDSGFRVLVNASLETMIDLDNLRARTSAVRLSMAGVVLKFAVVDRYGRLVMAVEHMNETPLGRKENISRTVVIEVLRKAGVWYLEIPFHYSGANARAQIRAVLRGKAAVQSGAAEDVA